MPWCLKGKITFLEVIKRISQMKSIEEYIAKKQNKKAKHEANWIIYDTV